MQVAADESLRHQGQGERHLNPGLRRLRTVSVRPAVHAIPKGSGHARGCTRRRLARRDFGLLPSTAWPRSDRGRPACHAGSEGARARRRGCSGRGRPASSTILRSPCRARQMAAAVHAPAATLREADRSRHRRGAEIQADRASRPAGRLQPRHRAFPARRSRRASGPAQSGPAEPLYRRRRVQRPARRAHRIGTIWVARNALSRPKRRCRSSPPCRPFAASSPARPIRSTIRRRATRRSSRPAWCSCAAPPACAS